MAEKVRWSVIGSCGIAKRRTIPEGIMAAGNAELVSVYDLDADANARLAAESGVEAARSQEELLAAPADAVYVATPAHMHHDHVLACVQAGRHVLCEKPLGLSSSEIREMISACRKAGLRLGVGFMMRFNVYHQKLRDWIGEGKLGIPVLARGQMTCWYPPIEGAWRQIPELGGGGALLDMGSHAVDVLEMLLGRTRSVFCRCTNLVHPYPVEDTALLMLEFESGACGTVEASFAVPDEASEFVLEVYGSRGAVKGKYSLGQAPGGKMQACLLGGAGEYDAQQDVVEKRGFEPFELETRNTYLAEIQEFSQAILDGRQAPVPGEDGLWNHAVIEAAYESARTGKPVEPQME